MPTNFPLDPTGAGAVAGAAIFFISEFAYGPRINEFVIDHEGADTSEFIEVSGNPDAAFGGLTLLVIEGDADEGPGTVDAAFAIGEHNAEGYWTTGLLSDQLENGTQTLALVWGFTGAVGDNIGASDDYPWFYVSDSIAVSDGDAGDITYGATTLTMDFDGGSEMVGGASRLPDRTDTDSPDDWVRNDFEGAGLPGIAAPADDGEAINTPGAVNEGVGVESGGSSAIEGSGERDVLRGTDGDDLICGFDGRDILYGGKGADELKGGAGRDILYGETGADLLKGGAGADILYGGNGQDDLRGGKGDDLLYGGNGADILDGGKGDDRLHGGNKADIFVGTDNAGDDVIADFDRTEGDVIDLSASSLSSLSDVFANAVDVAGGVEIALGTGSMTLSGENLADLVASDFAF